MKTKRRAKSKVTPSPLDPIKEEFLILQPAIAELTDKLKAEKKKMGVVYTKVRTHMEKEKLDTLEFAGFTFEFSTKEHCPFNEKNLEEMIEDKAIIEAYKERFSKSKTSFRLAKTRE